MKAILCLDQAAKSGYALLTRIESGARLEPILPGAGWNLAGYGTATRTLAAVDTVLGVVKRACDPREFAVVFEDHGDIRASRGANTDTILGMGAARGYWEHALDVLGQPKGMRFYVSPSTWRGGVLGRGAARLPRPKAKESALRWATAKTCDHHLSEDAAEAIVIAAWASIAIPRQVEVERARKATLRKRVAQ